MAFTASVKAHFTGRLNDLLGYSEHWILDLAPSQVSCFRCLNSGSLCHKARWLISSLPVGYTAVINAMLLQCVYPLTTVELMEYLCKHTYG
jgi:hypothetical protein